MVNVADFLAGVDMDQDDHSSLFSLRFPQCVVLLEVNSLTQCRLIACIMPIRANIIGPLFSAASVTQCAAART